MVAVTVAVKGVAMVAVTGAAATAAVTAAATAEVGTVAEATVLRMPRPLLRRLRPRAHRLPGQLKGCLCCPSGVC